MNKNKNNPSTIRNGALHTSFTLLLVSAISIQSTFSFVLHSSFPMKHRNQLTSTNLYYNFNDEVTEKFSSFPHPNLEDPIYLQAREFMNQAKESFSNNPEVVEETVFKDLSHVALDLSMFFIGPENTALLRFITIIGRLFSVIGDYIPDHSLRPDELAFQIGMLGVSSVLFSRSIVPRIKACMSIGIGMKPDALPERRNVVAYRNLFEPAGISWIQYKSLFASGVLDWEEIEADIEFQEPSSVYNQTKPQTTYLYWAYNKATKSFTSPENIGEMGCIQCLRKLEKRKIRTKTFVNAATTNSSSQDADLNFLYAQYKRKLSKDTTLLRVNTDKMIEVMEDNEGLSVSMLFLVVNCLQHKVMDHLLSVALSEAAKTPPLTTIHNSSLQTTQTRYYTATESQDLYS